MKLKQANQIIKYDCIFIGTGIISIMEAIHQSNNGKSVLMIDNSESIGGAWTPINVFGYKNVENAIHYFLPDKNAEKYMRDFFGWNIFVSNKKFQLRKIFIRSYIKLSYDGFINRLIKIVQKELKFQKKVKDITHLLLKKIRGDLQPSFYIKGGAKEMLHYTKEKLSRSKVKTVLNSEIDKIYLDNKNNQIEFYVDKEIFYAKKIFLTHGSRMKAISNNNGPIKVKEKIHPRPAAHLLIKDNTSSYFNELIIDNDFIKYIHDVTHMLDEIKNEKKYKLFIFGMGHEIEFNNNIYMKIVGYMKKRGLIGDCAELVSGHWTDVILPTITDADLYKIKNENESLVEILITENFSRAIGLYANKWSSNQVV